jgi:hypothetical protein
MKASESKKKAAFKQENQKNEGSRQLIKRCELFSGQ